MGHAVAQLVEALG